MAYDVSILRLPLMAIFDLKGKQTAVQEWCGAVLPTFPTRHNSFTQEDGRMLIWVGPDHWQVRAEISIEDALIADLGPDLAPSEVSVVLVSDTLVFFVITGKDADQVMAVASPLDLRELSADSAMQTEVFLCKAMIRRINDGYELAVDQSYAAMFAEYLDRVRS